MFAVQNSLVASVTLLVGATASMVLKTGGVSIGDTGDFLVERTSIDDSLFEEPHAALVAALDDRSAMLKRYRRVIRTILAEVVRDEQMMTVWKRELSTSAMTSLVTER